MQVFLELVWQVSVWPIFVYNTETKAYCGERTNALGFAPKI